MKFIVVKLKTRKGYAIYNCVTRHLYEQGTKKEMELKLKEYQN